MAPVVPTEDYYQVLKVDYSASTEIIIKSYKRLALLLHPDRNKDHNATEAFQLLVRAYETLKDENERRKYNLLHPKIKATSTTRQSTAPHSTSQTQTRTKKDEEDTSRERAGIAAILKAKAERSIKWSKTRKVYDDAIFELQREVRKLQTAIREIEDKEKQLEAEEAAKNSWKTWMLRPIYGMPAETEEEVESKSRERLARMHTKDIRKRELERKEQDLKSWEEQLRMKEKDKNVADQKNDAEKLAFEGEILRKDEKVKREKERLEREAQEKARRERMEKERIEREAAAKAWRDKVEKQRAENEAREKAQRERQEKERRELEARQRALREQQEKEWKEREALFRAQTFRGRRGRNDGGETFSTAAGSAFTARSACTHDQWWNKTEGRASCENCSVFRRHYYMQCPGCNMKACPNCMHSKLLPPARRGKGANANQRPHYQGARTSFSGYDYDYGYDL